MTIFTHATAALPDVNKTVGFQGRLTSNSGQVVPDGYYNMQFKIYEGGSGTTAGNPDGTPKWTEEYVNDNNNEGIRVKNGVFVVNLGTNNTFGTQVDWSADTLWLSINIAGTSQACSDFSFCDSDGEMTPMKRITATPFSLNSGAVGGKTAGELVHLGQSGPQLDTSDNTSISINKTGSGNLVDLQKNGNSVFSIDDSGTITLGSGDSQGTVSMSEASEMSNGSLTLSVGTAETGDGGNLVLQGGATNDTEGAAGKVIVQSDLEVVGDIESDGKVQSTALNIADSEGNSLLSADTAGANQVTIGGANSDTLLVLGSSSATPSEPNGVPGAMYYNSTTNKFRCYVAEDQSGLWKDCITPLPIAKVIGSDTSYNDLDHAEPIDVSNMSFDLAANTSYHYKFTIRHNSDAKELGIGFNVDIPETGSSTNWCANTIPLIDNSASSGQNLGSYCGVKDTQITTTGTSEGTGNFMTTMEGYLQTGTDITGGIKLRMVSADPELDDPANITIKEGSFGILQIVQKED